MPLQATNGAKTSEAALRRQKGKLPMQEPGQAQDKMSIVVNMTRARSAMRARYLAVGIFLSVLAITSKQLVDNLKRVWKIRGSVDSHSLGDRCFILEFTKEGDYNHVIRGGPWRYRGDAILIEALKDGEDPETVTWGPVPIWVQFKNIPHYLLSKELTTDLGRKLGSLINIDNNSRGDICSKFVRDRVLLPINKALQKLISLIDDVTEEEVVVYVFYERLPTSASTAASSDSKKANNYSPELCVDAFRHNDPRCWFLPETTGQGRRQSPSTLLWRIPSEPATSSSTAQTRIANTPSQTLSLPALLTSQCRICPELRLLPATSRSPLLQTPLKSNCSRCLSPHQFTPPTTNTQLLRTRKPAAGRGKPGRRRDPRRRRQPSAQSWGLRGHGLMKMKTWHWPLWPKNLPTCGRPLKLALVWTGSAG
ncbi:uncharacterized protein LOC112269893 [Brachypodium distachyon]|uniref:uncharacterized protein LOC112269893 n=1 Tax=Brachypodium distachyon TaxID=15368 RepID=UPI000D0CADFA|nr:uncharacterized protein LOC112269893 [Brachypodium distachyon]|eukprot:XP_024313138.1 uncharacterized protein LOC112269893 [Brachypodium distachyon]